MDEGDATPEPMYVVHVKPRHRVFVGDRANDRVVAFDDRTYAVEGMAPAGDGVFHMWADGLGRQLWVNNDVDNTTSVIDPRRLDVIATVPTPADLVAEGGKPHDVIVGPFGIFAYVSVVGIPGANDYVVQYNAHSFAELNRAAVGKDPHLSLALQHNRLYVPCQGTNEVIVLNRFTMEPIDHLDVPGAHGAGMARNGRTSTPRTSPGAAPTRSSRSTLAPTSSSESPWTAPIRCRTTSRSPRADAGSS
jgi:YVTN family beta-propeller protein